jgi:hypothetical protein
VATSPKPVSPLKPSCPDCRIKLQLVRVLPHPEHGAGFDDHEFVCRICGKTQTYMVRRKPESGAVR